MIPEKQCSMKTGGTPGNLGELPGVPPVCFVMINGSLREIL